MKTVYVTIGNSDNKLTQQQWSNFCTQLHDYVMSWSEKIHGMWFSLPNSQWQNACICFVSENEDARVLKNRLDRLRSLYQQDSIMWAECTPEFLTREVIG